MTKNKFKAISICAILILVMIFGGQFSYDGYGDTAKDIRANKSDRLDADSVSIKYTELGYIGLIKEVRAQKSSSLDHYVNALLE